MRQLLLHCMILIYLSQPSSGAPGGGGSRDMHLWRGEFEHALSGEGGELDRAAYLTLTGEYGKAMEMLAGDPDSLRLGILASKAERFDEASLLLGRTESNPHLEIYRLMHRAAAFEAQGMHSAAVRDLEMLLGKDASTYLGMRPRELFVTASYRGGADPDSMIAFMKGIDRFYGISAFMLADRLIEEGRLEEAGDAFLRGIEAVPDTLSRRLFDELFERFSVSLERFADDELFELTMAALSFDALSKASMVIEEIGSRSTGHDRAELLRGKLLEADNKRKKALEVYERVFESTAPVELKKEALLRKASLQYDLERYVKAADSYRLFGLYYPGDRRSSYALDVSARIYVSRQLFDDALETWRRLRGLGRSDRTAREAALSEAVLRHSRGDSGTAYRILKDLLAAGVWRQEPAVFYWLHVASDTPNERSVWKRRLKESYPNSFYTAAVEHGSLPFRFERDGSSRDGGDIVGRLEQRERAFVQSVSASLRPAEPLVEEEAYNALVYFLERGFIEEARCCIGVLERRYGSDAVAMASLYATVRSSGLVDVGLKLLWTKGLSGADSPLDNSLRYPVAYSSFVSREAERNGLPDELLLAVIREESSFDRFAVSRAGALGLMQLMPRTGSWIGGKIRRGNVEEEDLLSPEFNIAAGAWYLRYLLDRSEDSIVAALASYNGGETRLSRWRKSFEPSDHPLLAIEMIGPRETRRYVKRVLDSMANYRSLATSDGEQ